jgi:hypothetical protein
VITFFTIPKPFKGHSGVIQKNAILSWQQITERCEIIVFGDDPSVIQFSNQIGVKCVSHFKSNDYGTPLLDSIWKSAKSTASNDLICYINSDIILFPDFAEKISTIKLKEFLIAGRRWDIEIEKLIDFNNDWEFKLRELIKNKGVLHPVTGVDYFLFPKKVMPEMPPFAIGRAWWDNWLLTYFSNNKTPIIDGTAITTVHQNHDYSHIKSKNNKTSNKGLERNENKALASLKNWELKDISDCTHIFKDDGIEKVDSKKKLIRIFNRYFFGFLAYNKSIIKRLLNLSLL